MTLHLAWVAGAGNCIKDRSGISGANFLDTPAVSLTPLENSPSTNVITLIATAISKTSVSVKAFNTSDGSAAPTGGQTTINLTATGA